MGVSENGGGGPFKGILHYLEHPILGNTHVGFGVLGNRNAVTFRFRVEG